MKNSKTIHLIRHFKVLDEKRRFYNSKEIDEWVKRYDISDLEFIEVAVPKHTLSFTSSLSRAKRSADYLGLEYDSLPLFDEVSTKAFIDTKLRLPIWLWLGLGRILWMLDLVKKSENRSISVKRAKEAATFLIDLKEKDIVVVTHGFFMILLQRELKKSGFKGEFDSHPKNAKVYTFKS
jgi:broad specificity phosphatase PhoE